MRPAIGDSLVLDEVISCEHQLRLDRGLESLPSHTAQLDVCSRGRRWVLIIIKVTRTSLRERGVDLIEAQSLGEVLLIETRRAAVGASEERVDPRPLIPHDVVQVVRGATGARILDARVRLQKHHTLLLRLPCIGRPACGLRLRRRLCCLKRQKPEVLLVRAAEVWVHAAADGLSDTRAPVREKQLPLLVGKRGLGLHVRIERGRHRCFALLTEGCSIGVLRCRGQQTSIFSQKKEVFFLFFCLRKRASLWVFL